MNLNGLLKKFVDFIDYHKKVIITTALVILGVIILAIVFILSSDEFSISKESNYLLENIENRKYEIAINYYEDLQKKFSTSKMGRFNRDISKKINRTLITNGDKLIDGQISKEQYIGLINTINLIKIDIKVEDVIDQSKRVCELYISEDLSYDISRSYINTANSLTGIGNSLDDYDQKINTIKESRDMYKNAKEQQQVKKYYEAINDYNKVITEDEKYFKLAKSSKEESIELMYDYYIEKSIDANDKGNYEEALLYIEYLKPYYDDEKVLKLESKYQKNHSSYTLTSQDIINLISHKSGINKENLSINSYQEMVNGDKYYYVELHESDKLIDEVMINAKTRKLYSYKDKEKDYKNFYCDGYFKEPERGKFIFGINKDQAIKEIESVLNKKNVSFKGISIVSKDKADSYIESEKEVKELENKNKGTYYYALVNKGWFRSKELYMIEMYKKNIYLISEESIKKLK